MTDRMVRNPDPPRTFCSPLLTRLGTDEGTYKLSSDGVIAVSVSRTNVDAAAGTGSLHDLVRLVSVVTHSHNYDDTCTLWAVETLGIVVL